MNAQRMNACRSIVVAGALACAACSEDAYVDEAFGVMDLAPYYPMGATANNPAGGLPISLNPLRGYSRGEVVELYDFGAIPTTRDARGAVVAFANPMYFFFDDEGRPLFAEPVREERTGRWVIPGGRPTRSPNQTTDADRNAPHSLRARRLVQDPRRKSTAHQRPIIDIGPEALGTRYTGLWEIVEARVTSSSYLPDDIKSFATLDGARAAGAVKLRRTGKVVFCPLLDERTGVTPPVAAQGTPIPRIELWYRRKLGSCLLANGWETLAGDAGLIEAGADAMRVQTFEAEHMDVVVGTEVRDEMVVPAGRLYVPMAAIAAPAPGQAPFEYRWNDNWVVEERPKQTLDAEPGYSPLKVLWDIVVPAEPKFQPGSLTTLAGVDESSKKMRAGPLVRAVATVGVSLARGMGPLLARIMGPGDGHRGPGDLMPHLGGGVEGPGGAR